VVSIRRGAAPGPRKLPVEPPLLNQQKKDSEKERYISNMQRKGDRKVGELATRRSFAREDQSATDFI